MAHSPTRIAAAALLGVTASACLVALPTPAESLDPPGTRRGALVAPLKNTTYKGEETAYGVTVKATVRIGGDTGRVKKATFRLRCDEGRQKVVRTNLKMYDIGRFYSTKPGTNVSGDWLGKHKVDLVVQTSNDKPCSGLAFNFVARD